MFDVMTASSMCGVNDAVQIENNPELVRLTTCGLFNISEANVGSWEGNCESASEACPYSQLSLPWLTCKYKSLSTFWQVRVLSCCKDSSARSLPHAGHSQ